MIELKHIYHSFGNKKILQNLSLELKANQLSCLLGGSGSGKTTILRLIAGLEIASKGDILIANKLVSENNILIKEAHQRNIGFVFQDLALWPHFSVFKNIAFGLQEKQQSKQQIKKSVFEILDFFDLTEHANKFPHQLSGGQKQLVAISRSLILEPKILLMDEPLANLDVKLKRKILDYIKSIKQKYDLTIVYVTHDHREAFAIADNIVVLNKGKIEDKGNVNEIKKSKNEFVKYFLEY